VDAGALLANRSRSLAERLEALVASDDAGEGARCAISGGGAGKLSSGMANSSYRRAQPDDCPSYSLAKGHSLPPLSKSENCPAPTRPRPPRHRSSRDVDPAFDRGFGRPTPTIDLQRRQTPIWGPREKARQQSWVVPAARAILCDLQAFG